jgi:hypothetical protein
MLPPGAIARFAFSVKGILDEVAAGLAVTAQG